MGTQVKSNNALGTADSHATTQNANIHLTFAPPIPQKSGVHTCWGHVPTSLLETQFTCVHYLDTNHISKQVALTAAWFEDGQAKTATSRGKNARLDKK